MTIQITPEREAELRVIWAADNTPHIKCGGGYMVDSEAYELLHAARGYLTSLLTERAALIERAERAERERDNAIDWTNKTCSDRESELVYRLNCTIQERDEARAEIRCEYCGPGMSTGLPGNACENCMNTGLKYPEITAELRERRDAAIERAEKAEAWNRNKAEDMTTLAVRLGKAAAERDRLADQVKAMKEALAPFTHYAVTSIHIDADAVDGFIIRVIWAGSAPDGNQPMFAHFDAARAALQSKV